MVSASLASPIMTVATTVGDAAQAHQLAAAAVAARLAACAQVEAITSHFVWQGQQQTEGEWRIVCKTTAACADRLAQWLVEHHPYELPQLTAQPVLASAAYAAWVAAGVEAAVE